MAVYLVLRWCHIVMYINGTIGLHEGQMKKIKRDQRAYFPGPNLEYERDTHCIKSHRLRFNVCLIKKRWMESTEPT